MALPEGLFVMTANPISAGYRQDEWTEHTVCSACIERAWGLTGCRGRVDTGESGEEGEGGEGAQAMVDMDMLVLGMLIGFVWPLGSAGWVVKEEGMLGYNWRLFVTFGFLLSALIGMVKSIGGWA